MAAKSKFLLLVHECYSQKIAILKKKIQHLKMTLSESEFLEHEDVKFAARLRKATMEIIPEDPDRIEYRLKGNLRKFRRYKQGLQRYRLMFSFSSVPPIIVYLYINDASTLRKEGSKSDPHHIFSKKVEQGYFSHDPSDPKIQQWLSNRLLNFH
jgi:toxin YhaV